MFAGGLLKATEYDLTSLFMTRMQCIGLAKDEGIQKWSQHRHSRTSQGKTIIFRAEASSQKWNKNIFLYLLNEKNGIHSDILPNFDVFVHCLKNL